jgi:hypothetical protein
LIVKYIHEGRSEGGLIDIDSFLLFIVIIMDILVKVFFTAFVFFLTSAIVASSED